MERLRGHQEKQVVATGESGSPTVVGSGGGGLDIGVPGVTAIEEIGRGGFGIVYRARQPDFDREVAVKLITAPLIDAETTRRFERERRALGAVSAHPNIVTVFDAGVTESGRPYLIMDFMPRGSMAERLASEGPMRWEEVATTGTVLAGALETAHRAGILHRDIKPENVLVSAFGEPHLADFGIARVAHGTETRSGVISASIGHASPEILEGQRPAPTADVYSLGSTLAALLLGHAPFVSRTDESLQPIIVRILTQPPPDLRDSGVPDPLAAALERALSKDPADRYQSAEEMGQALIAATAEAGSQPTTMRLGAMPPGDTTAPTTDAPAQEAARPDPTRVHGRGSLPAEPAAPEEHASEQEAAEAVGAYAADTAAPRTEPETVEPDQDEPDGTGAVAGAGVTNATVAPVSPDETTTTPPDAPPPPVRPADITSGAGGGGGGRRVATIAAAVVAALGASVVGVLALTGGGGDEPDPRPSASPSPAAENEAPEPSDVTLTVAQGTVRELRLRQFGSDPDGDDLEIEVEDTSTAAGGSVEVLANGRVRYTAPADFEGDDEFTFTLSDGSEETTGTVAIQVTRDAPANEAPTANDVSRTVDQGASVTIPLDELGTDPNGDELTIEVTDSPRGNAQVTAGGIRYTAPSSGSSDTFAFTLSDGELTGTGTVSITLRPTQISGGTTGGGTSGGDTTTTTGPTSPPNQGPTARISRSTGSGTAPLTVSFDGSGSSDADGRIASYGWTFGDGASGSGAQVSHTYDSAGSYTVTLTVTDDDGARHSATTSISVSAPQPTNQPPSAKNPSATVNAGASRTFTIAELGSDPDGDALTVSAGGSSARGGTVQVVSGGLRYTAPSGYSGSDSFNYTISDGKASATGSVSITVQGGNAAPVANNDSASTNSSTPITIDVLCNDTDADGDTLTISSATQPQQGFVNVVSGGSCGANRISFNPDGHTGTFTFTYTVSDGNLGSDTATVTVTVT